MRRHVMGYGRYVAAILPLLALAGCGSDPEVQRLENPTSTSACACLTSGQLGIMNDCTLTMTADAVGVEGSDPNGGAVTVQIVNEGGDVILEKKLEVKGTTVRWSWTPNLPLKKRREQLTVYFKSTVNETVGTALELTTDVIDPTTPGPFVLCASWVDDAGIPLVRGSTFGPGDNVGMRALLFGDLTPPLTLDFTVFEDDQFTDDDLIETVPVTLTLDGTMGTSTWLTVPQTDDPGPESEFYFSATSSSATQPLFDTANSLLIYVQ